MKTEIKTIMASTLMITGLVSYKLGQWTGPSPDSALAYAGGTDPVVNQLNGQKAGDPNNLSTFVSLAKQAVPSVVNISTLTTVKAAYNQGSPEDLFRYFFGEGFGPPGMPRGVPNSKLPKSAALGTGFIVDTSGIILTNNHVVSGADQIKIQFTESPDEKPTEGKVIGRDPELDVALIKVNTSRTLVPLALGDSDALQVGEYVMAVGNPFGNGHSVTHGIVSAKGRMSPGIPLANYLQIDAPINPGNSGGPLLNLKGQVVGINNAIDARAQGIGFAIPINYVKKVISQLQNHGKVDRGYIGAVIAPLSSEVAEKFELPPNIQAPFVVQVNPGTPAEVAGIHPYDVITEVDGSPVHTPNELILAITSAPIGKKIPLKIVREGKERTLTIETKLRPSDQLATNDSQPTPSHEESIPGTGLFLKDLSPTEGKGVAVTAIAPGSPADLAGLRPGDILLEVDRKEIQNKKTLDDKIKNNMSYLLRIKRLTLDGPSLYSVVLLDLRKTKDSG